MYLAVVGSNSLIYGATTTNSNIFRKEVTPITATFYLHRLHLSYLPAQIKIYYSLQVLINGVWMVISPARAIHHYPTREDNLLVCSSYIDASYMIAFTYPIFLIVVCTVYAVLTRKIPEAFNESKHIGK